MKKSRIVISLGVCISIATLFGCSSSVSTPPAEPAQSALILRQPELVEKRLFSTVSDYYCEHKRWPASFADIEAFEERRGRPASELAEFRMPVISSQRAIVMTIKYQNALGVERTVSFIAPPRCDSGSDSSRVSIAAGRIKFSLLDGCELLSGKEIKRKWKAPPYPDVVWRGDDEILIAVRFGDVAVGKEEVRGLAPDIEAAYESSVPGLVWIQGDANHNGSVEGVVHEFESDSSRGRLVTRVFSTSFDGRLMAITVIGLATDRARVDEVAAAIDESLSID